MIDVVYLAYANKEINYGIEIVENFLASYKRFSPGVEHNLVIAAKNWTDNDLYEKLCSLASDYDARLIDLPDDGLDIGAFIRSAEILENEFVFFFGSNVEILCDNWLLNSYNAFKNDANVQLAGPMGSFEKGISGRFPNPHIRTCAFMIRRKLFLEYASTQEFPKIKQDTWRMEHCSDSLSDYIYNKGYEAVVVNSDGEFFTKENWINSRTYIAPDDSKGMVADKWVKRYHMARENFKVQKEMIVWGKNLTKYPGNLVTEFSEKVNIFIPYFDITPVITSNIFHPVFYGECTQKLETEAITDNTGFNISNNFAKYGELTAYYWVWMNFLSKTTSEYVGFCQTRHFLDFNISNVNIAAFRPVFANNFEQTLSQYNEENILKCIEDNDVILPEKIDTGVSVYEQYLQNYPKAEIDLASDVINEFFPAYSNSAIEFITGKTIYPFGNFVMKKEIFNEFCDWLFNVLNIIENQINCNEQNRPKDMLQSCFISERFFNIWLLHNIKNNNLKVKTVTSLMVYSDINAYLAKCVEEINRIKELQRLK